MMAGPHATSGAAGWLGGCALLTATGHHPSWTVILGGAAIAAGAALLPDADHGSSLVAQTFGAPSRWLCRAIGRGCARLHAATRTERDVRDFDGHRTLLHSVAAALALGGLVSLAAWLGGALVAGVVAFCCTGLGLRAVMPKRRRGPLVRAFGGLAAAVAVALLGDGSWWWVGIPVAFGCLAHIGGDALTNTGVPALFPIKIRGARWYRLGIPRALRFGTGGAAERVVWWLCLVVAAGSSWVLVF